MLGANPVELGLLNSFQHIMSTFISVPIGWFQDRYSLRKIFLFGISISTLLSLIYALAINWTFIIPAMFLSAFAASLGSCLTICDVSISDEERSMCKGICDGVFAAPSLLAPAIAAIIITYYGGIGIEGIRPLYWLQFIAGLVLLFFLITQLTEIKRSKDTTRKGFFKDLIEVFKKGSETRRWIFFSSSTTFSSSISSPFIQVFAYEIKNADQFILGGMVISNLLVQIVFSAWIGGLAVKTGRKKIIYLIEPLKLFSILILIFSPSSLFLLISALIGGFQIIADYVCITPLMVNRVPIQYIGRWRGITGMFQSIVAIPAPIIGGIIWENFGPNYVFLISILVSLMRLPILATIPEKK
jgi:MFS family permease